MKRRFGLFERSVAGQVLVLQLVILLLFGAAAVTALVLQAQQASLAEARERSLAGAETFANAPGTLDAMRSAHPSALLQPRAEAARKGSGVDYIVAFSPAGYRWTHPDPRLIGKHVTGTYGEALAGHPHTSTFETPVGQAVDSTVPVLDSRGKVVGLVAVGITVRSVHARVAQHLPLMFGAAGGALLLATAGSALVSHRLRRQTRGLEPAELRRMYDHHDAVLHAAREGVLIVDEDGWLVLVNDEARRLLGLPEDVRGRRVTDLGLEPGLAALLADGRQATDEVREAGERMLAVSVRPTAPYGGPPGSVVTLRDTTELRAVTGKAAVAERRLRLLYDAMTGIGTTLDVERTAEELTRFTVPRFSDYASVDLVDSILRGGHEPEGTMMRRTALTGIHENHPLYPVGKLIDFGSATPQAIGFGTGEPVLEAHLPDLTGWQEQDPVNARLILEHGIHSMMVIPLRARGILMGVASFWRSERPEPFEEQDVAVAEELVARAALAIDNARRYTREHTTAVTLQRSLLPRGVPEQSALDVAYRYLPAQAGVGGDWFDVIPLPGARVALVVGDVVGHGLHAAATMGRLRTAVHNFSALDQSPDELLAHLDELVSRIDSDETGDQNGGSAITGATCLYALYDPVAGRVTVARAGHPGPALVLPDGTAAYPDVPVSPPLGLGFGMPVEARELALPEGSRLVLYTDGLVEDRDRDLDTGLEQLRATLAGRPGRTPEETCADILGAVLPARPSDDVALLVARTRLLDRDRIADWEVRADPAAVAPVRAACARTLDGWGLTDIGYTTELILSELITNAIRYGSPPIRVRLLYDRSLVCEVSDGSSTAPHLRRAAVTDEGGRGLFLVARLAARWGTRYTARGKVIWAEQSLRADRHEPTQTADDLLDQWDDSAP
ncbi:SpoIIE family protein phosphatase/ATP-binding protein [Streptomyces sp. Ag109_G2-15]|uniref:SpoIIE family protein phosphatase/ATP-binding protein n=1 Tax=Streptomyces sp. Ag109_G2-15 TaxID=1938850 RepID=UPI000BC9509D|nr:SpoIIE family protein phosphatase/ATP-binding protein [Streptomyces sp. Ag109_G2-15]SOD81119.1 PAS domain S-box-containing protein [Streptomyces sp. Ag109_G2-15]